MQKSAARPRSLLAGLARFVPALLAFAAALAATDWLVPILLLVGDALMLTALCASIGFDMEESFVRSIARRGLAALLVLVLFAVFIAACCCCRPGGCCANPPWAERLPCRLHC